MEIGQLEAFLYVVQHLNFSHAAKAMGLTQPSLSARMLALEREIGEPLFHRMGRGVRLTDAGPLMFVGVQMDMKRACRPPSRIRGMSMWPCVSRLPRSKRSNSSRCGVSACVSSTIELK